MLVGTQKGVVYAYDIEGKLQWKSKLSSEILSAPKYFDGIVIARTGDSRIYGINANDGSRKWVYDRTSPALTLRSSAGVVVDGGAVYAGFGGGKLIAIRADNGTHMVAKTALTFRDSYVDVRKFDVAEWREHVPLAEALLKANKKELIGDGVENSVRNAWDNLWEPRRR